VADGLERGAGRQAREPRPRGRKQLIQRIQSN
jgi:hypothetical protein